MVLVGLEELEWGHKPCTTERVASVTDRSESSVENLLRMTAEQGFVRRAFDGWRLTDRGRAEARKMLVAA